MEYNPPQAGSLYSCNNGHSLNEICAEGKGNYRSEVKLFLCQCCERNQRQSDGYWLCVDCEYFVCSQCRPQLEAGKFGLYSGNNAQMLVSLDTEVEINNSIASVTLTQVYHNPSDKVIDTEYLFPVNDLGIFDDFEAIFEGRLVKGVIKKKDEAKKEFKEGVKKGHMMGYAEIKEDTPDIMEIKLGNLPPKQQVTIKLRYLQELEISQNQFWKFQLLGTLTPRFPNDKVQPVFRLPPNWLQHKEQVKINAQKPSYPNMIQVMGEWIMIEEEKEDHQIKEKETLNIVQVNPDQTNRTWTICVKIYSNEGISQLFSPSHEIETFAESKFVNITTFNSQKVYKPDQDFVLLFATDNIWKPQAVLARSQNNGYCSMVTFIPKFNEESMDDAQLAAMKSNDFDTDLDAAQGEFIFVLDRSGSMSGNRMKMANEAVILFLKSLPSQCYFNIISFGEPRMEPMYKQSIIANDVNVQRTVAQVQTFKADMGCTDINKPLNFAYNSQYLQHIPKLVFLLTDGDVTNPDQVIKLAKKYSKKCRTYTIGLGSGASSYLVKEVANNGRGKYELILDSKNLAGKMVYLLTASLTPILDDFKFKFDESVVEFMIPGINTPINVLKNEPIRLFVFLNQKFSQLEATEVTMSYYDSIEGKEKSHTITIDKGSQVNNNSISKLGVNQIIKDFERGLLLKESPDIYAAKKLDYDKQILDLSLDYQVLCKKTAFICTIKENAVNQNDVKENIVIPSIISKDHQKVDMQKKQQSINQYSRQIGVYSQVQYFQQNQGGGLDFDGYSDDDEYCDDYGDDDDYDMGDGDDDGGFGSFGEMASGDGDDQDDDPAIIIENMVFEAKDLMNDDHNYKDALPKLREAIRLDKEQPSQANTLEALEAIIECDSHLMNKADIKNDVKQMLLFFSNEEVSKNNRKDCLKTMSNYIKVFDPQLQQEINQDVIDYLEKNDMGGLSIDHEIALAFQLLDKIVLNQKVSKPQKKSKPVKKSQFTPDQALMEVIKLQKQSGCWEKSNLLMELLELQDGEIPNDVSQLIPNNEEKENIWFTILVATWLNKKQSHKKAELKFINKKSLNWLKKRNIKYQVFAASALKALQI